MDATASTNSAQVVTSIVKYNTAGAPVSQTDPLERTVKIGYADNFNASGTFNTFAYPTTLTDPAGNFSQVKYRYDIGANVWAKSPAPAGNTTGKETTREYDLVGRALKETIVNTAPTRARGYPTNGIKPSFFRRQHKFLKDSNAE